MEMDQETAGTKEAKKVETEGRGAKVKVDRAAMAVIARRAMAMAARAVKDLESEVATDSSKGGRSGRKTRSRTTYTTLCLFDTKEAYYATVSIACIHNIIVVQLV